jgi:hypothetical protein
MTHVLINNAPDGQHVRTFKTEAAALKALAEFLGRKVEGLAINRSYVSDWGNRLIVEKRAAGHTAAREIALANAFDAREMGTATKRQLALLDKYERPEPPDPALMIGEPMLTEPAATEAELERMRDELANDPRVRIGKAVARDRENER